MTDERFNQLLNGPLSHPMPMFALMRIAGALRAVLEVTGRPGELALEDYCAMRQQADDHDAELENEDRH